MRELVTLLSSVMNDGPIVGYGPYLRYRLAPSLGHTDPMQVTVAGQTVLVRPGTPDLRVAFQSLRSELDILSELLPRDFDGLIVDAGGYIGTAALTLTRMYPAATVVTIEASSRNFEVLTRNVFGKKRIVPINAAPHAETGRSFDLVDRGTGAWGFSIAASGGTTTHAETVTTITLQDVTDSFPGKPVGIVKMDIEGGEHALFESRDPTLEAADAVFIELHDRIVPGCTDLFRAFSRNRWLLNAGGEKFLSLRRTLPEAAPPLSAEAKA